MPGLLNSSVVCASNSVVPRRTSASLGILITFVVLATGCVSVSIGTRPAATFAPAPSASAIPLPPQEVLIDAVATRLREELARSPADGWANHVEIVYERTEGSLAYAIVRVDDDDLPGAWLALIAAALGDTWSVIGSRWATDGGVGASDLNLVPVDAYPYDPALIGFLGPEIVAVAIVDPLGEREDGAIVDHAVDLPIARNGALGAWGEDGLRFAIPLASYGPIPAPGSEAVTSPEAGEVVAQVALALVEGTVGETTAVVDPEARLSLQALEQILQQEDGPWTTAGSPSRFGRYFAVPLEGGGDPFTLIAAVVAAPDGHLVLQAATLTR